MLHVQSFHFKKVEVKTSDCYQTFSGEYNIFFKKYLLKVEIILIMAKGKFSFESRQVPTMRDYCCFRACWL